MHAGYCLLCNNIETINIKQNANKNDPKHRKILLGQLLHSQVKINSIVRSINLGKVSLLSNMYDILNNGWNCNFDCLVYSIKDNIMLMTPNNRSLFCLMAL